LGVLGYVGVLLIAVTMFFCGLWQSQFGTLGHKTRWSEEIPHLLGGVSTMLMLFFIFNRESFGARILSVSWLRFTGIISFEWFLFHQPIVNWFQEHSPAHANGNLFIYAWKTVVPLIITFGLAVLVYRYFSLPILNCIRNNLKRE
jgi:peptidoglycan/LPS O-acetylase OafA/YrhL